MRDTPARTPEGDGSDSWGALARDARSHLLRSALPVLLPVAVMWMLLLVRLVTGNWLTLSLSLEARELSGLIGIVTMPLVHSGFAHLIGNTAAWLLLGGLIALLDRRFPLILLLIWLLSGAVLWVIGTPWVCQAPGSLDCAGHHIGASGVTYGFGAFLIAYGLLTRRIVAVLVAVLVLLVHGVSMLFGMLPFTAGTGVSWTAHLSGAIAGVVVALLMTRTTRAARAARA